MANHDGQTRSLNARLELFLNLAPVRTALEQCGLQHVAFQLRLLADKRTCERLR
jgi:hypothetical protein